MGVRINLHISEDAYRQIHEEALRRHTSDSAIMRERLEATGGIRPHYANKFQLPKNEAAA